VTISGTDRLHAPFKAQAIAARLEGGWRYATPFAGITPYAAVQTTAFRLLGLFDMIPTIHAPLASAWRRRSDQIVESSNVCCWHITSIPEPIGDGRDRRVTGPPTISSADPRRVVVPIFTGRAIHPGRSDRPAHRAPCHLGSCRRSASLSSTGNSAAA
jgi:hypothetical protein